jgi:ELWxxDGT repeat protein
LLLCAGVAAAEPALPSAFLVKDINTQPLIFWGNPRQLKVAGGRLYFVAETPQGTGLWTSDGTTAGTVLLRTLQVVGDLTGAGERLFFVASDPDHGAELWTSDGTSVGTVLVRDIRPGPTTRSPTAKRATFSPPSATAVLLRRRRRARIQLWRSDGATGTQPVARVGAGEMIAAGDVLLFVGYDTAHGSALWRSDGTAEGTQLVRDINPGAADDVLYGFGAVGATLYFRADDGVHGSELWKSDTTTDGTALVKDINPGGESSYPDQFVAVGSELFFQAFDGEHPQIWRSDGSAAGTVPVVAMHVIYYGRVALGSVLLFVNEADLQGGELWKTDGTSAGTELVKDINPGSGTSYPTSLTLVNEAVFFMADDGYHGRELWRTDGTASGTVMVRDINPGTPSSDRVTATRSLP